MAQNIFRGLGVALITPFKADGSVDYQSLKRLVEFQIDNGADFLCILATTGEAPCLTQEEKDKITELVLDVNKGRVKILKYCGGNNTAAVVEEIKNTNWKGIDGILSICPYYNKPSQEGLYQHFKAIAQVSPLPIVLYNVPGRTGVNMKPETTCRIARDFPNVVAVKEASGSLEQVDEIIKIIGKVEERDYNNGGIYHIRTKDGRLLKVADLVEDHAETRNLVQGYLQRIKKRDDVDIIIALGTAKEGFDWQWCEECLTIGVRGSLTEVVQIIGRCTRDCEGKETAKFVNMIGMPDANQPDVKVAVNDFLKAITASLLMEQVMAPSWHFKTVKDVDSDEGSPLDARTLVIEGLKPLSSEKTKMIVEEQLDDLKASILQDELVVKAISGSTTAETITKTLIPKVIRERYPDLSEDEVEEVRQRLLLDTLVKGGEVVDDKGNPIDFDASANDEEKESEGNRLIKLANRMININQLSINLIDSINPFQRAYEVLSKNVDKQTLKIIQDTMAEQKFDMTIEQAMMLFKGPYKQWVAEHDGLRPDINDPDPKVRELAAAFQKLKNLKIRKMMGLEYEPEK